MNKDLDFGTLVISLDFELMWGMKDIATPEGYGQTNVANVRLVIDRLISLFEKYDIQATIAAVGLIFAENPEKALDFSPELKPEYSDQELSPYSNNYIQNISEDNFSLYFAPDIISKLKGCENIEIGTHTFCHYYCNEKGQNTEQFRQDLESAIRTAKRFGIRTKSIIFPRNEVNNDCLNICREFGITSYRGNALRYFEATSTLGRLKNRACRFIDTYFPINNSTTYDYSTLREDELCNIRASRFLSPYSRKLSLLNGLKLSRIRKEITAAAKNHQLYHLWWHPHNFGAHTEENFNFLEKVLQHFSDCRDKHGMKSLSMNQLASLLQPIC